MCPAPDTPPSDAAAAAHRGLRWDLWCRVIDNHGDLGVCWRLAADLAARGERVRLWVDDAAALAWLAPQGAPGVDLRAWAEPAADAPLADVVVEAFGCDPPAGLVARMAAAARAGGVAPVWINLEYLSAEGYVERSHGLRSPQLAGPGAGLDKWFFYPGFTPATGGLLREPWMAEAVDLVALGAPADRAADPAPNPARPPAAQVLRDALHGAVHGADHEATFETTAAPSSARLALLFCYDNPALPALLEAFAAAPTPWLLLVTPGLALQAVQRWATGRGLLSGGWPAPAAAHRDVAACGALSVGRLTLLPIAPVAQRRFDDLLAACDLLFVRGEDSFVRAHWAGRPFVWQAYVQDDGAHQAKLEAWLRRYRQAGAASDDAGDTVEAQDLERLHRLWNGGPKAVARPDFAAAMAGALHALTADGSPASASPGSPWHRWQALARRAAGHLMTQPDLVTQLRHFVAERRQSRAGGAGD